MRSWSPVRGRCDDATFSSSDGTVLGFFDREADTQEDAVLSAIHNVESADIGARVLRVTQDDDWLTASEIAERLAGLARASGYWSVATGDLADSCRRCSPRFAEPAVELVRVEAG